MTISMGCLRPSFSSSFLDFTRKCLLSVRVINEESYFIVNYSGPVVEPNLWPQRVINCLLQRAIKSSSFSPVSVLSGGRKETWITTQDDWKTASKIPLWLEPGVGWDNFIRVRQIPLKTPLFHLVLFSLFFSSLGCATQTPSERALGNLSLVMGVLFVPQSVLIVQKR